MKMTKRFLSAVAAVSAMMFCLNAQSISVTNTFGGDTDNLSGDDFLVFDKDGNKEDVHVSDRLQLDVASEHLDSRVRLDFNGAAKKDGKDTAVQTRGYVNLRPVQPVNIIAGNKFFTKWAMKQGYLAAFDDNLLNSKLCGDNGAALLVNVSGLQVAGGFGYEKEMDLNCGASYTVDDVVAIGATAQNVTNKTRSISGYVGILAVENLAVNLGYSYNMQKYDYLPSTEHAAIVSASYSFEDLGLFIAADALVDLSGRYYSEASEEFVDREDKDGKYNAFGTAVYASYDVNDTLSVSCKGIIYNADKDMKVNNVLSAIVYPAVTFNTEVGSLTTGIRINFNKDDGFDGFSVPFSWKYKFKIK